MSLPGWNGCVAVVRFGETWHTCSSQGTEQLILVETAPQLQCQVRRMHWQALCYDCAQLSLAAAVHQLMQFNPQVSNILQSAQITLSWDLVRGPGTRPADLQPAGLHTSSLQRCALPFHVRCVCMQQWSQHGILARVRGAAPWWPQPRAHK